MAQHAVTEVDASGTTREICVVGPAAVVRTVFMDRETYLLECDDCPDLTAYSRDWQELKRFANDHVAHVHAHEALWTR